jgi:uncharacterized protein (TIGR02118 family)
MFKAMVMLSRGDRQTQEEFVEWWTVEHAPLAKTLPGLRRAVFNVVTDDGSDVDGIAELWFDSQEDFESAYRTDVGRAVAQDSLDHVARRNRYLVEEHTIYS